MSLAHSAHAPPSGPSYPKSQTQSVCSLLPEADTVNAGQLRQVVALVAPRSVEKVSAPHKVQASDPALVLYVPAAHGLHGPKLLPVYPAVQLHVALPSSLVVFCGHGVQLVAPVFASEYSPAKQFAQSSEPGDPLYVPPAHALHVPPSGPVYPALQMQPVTGPLPAELSVFGGHVVHASTLAAPVPGW